MKIALLGKGKTGSKAMDLAKDKGYEITIFDSQNRPTRDTLAGHDVILSFLTGDIFLDYLPLLSEVKIPVVSGSTGFDWTTERINLVNDSQVPWIHANNFSLGMNLVKSMIQVLSKASTFYETPNYKIHEIHHTKKIDAPSGTAKAWESWLENQAEMTYERTGDVVGTHELTLETDNERITLKHEALDRKIFAEGALWACDQIKTLSPGLHDFSQVAIKAMAEA